MKLCGFAAKRLKILHKIYDISHNRQFDNLSIHNTAFFLSFLLNSHQHACTHVQLIGCRQCPHAKNSNLLQLCKGQRCCKDAQKSLRQRNKRFVKWRIKGNGVCKVLLQVLDGLIDNRPNSTEFLVVQNCFTVPILVTDFLELIVVTRRMQLWRRYSLLVDLLERQCNDNACGVASKIKILSTHQYLRWQMNIGCNE